METSVRGDIWQKDSSISQDVSESRSDVWFGDSGTDKKTGSAAEDVQMFRMDRNRNNSEEQLRLSGLKTKLERPG